MENNTEVIKKNSESKNLNIDKKKIYHVSKIY